MAARARAYLSDPGLAVVIVLGALACFLPFRLGTFHLAYYSDDFFYYVVVARNLAATGVSTFNGIVPANGYHPLWLIVLAGLWKVFGQRWFFLAEGFVLLAGAVATYLLAVQIFTLSRPRTISESLDAVWVALFYLYLGRTGMEIVLTIPLALWFVRCALGDRGRFGIKDGLLLGLLASAVILSRLDSAILIALVGGFYLFLGEQPVAGRVRFLIAAAVGLLPVYIYLASNKIIFGGWMPISSDAKHLRHGFLPYWRVMRSIVVPFGLGVFMFVIVAMVLLVIGFALLRREKSRPRNQSIVLAALLTFPIVYYPLLSIVSDWKLWSWYNFPLLLSSVASLLLLADWLSDARLLDLPAYRAACAVLLIIIVAGFLVGLTRPAQARELYAAATDVQSFAATHPGRYAMGDRAGIVAYLLPDPVIQLEGLMMDRAYLANIREQRSLNDVLNQYGARYYIATSFSSVANGCYATVEPRLAGPDSPHMQGTFCMQPIAAFPQDRVWIFDVAPAR
jgi:hypothetical protein